MMLKLVRSPAEVPIGYRGTPIADLLAYHNMGAPHDADLQADILIGMCMDPRVRLRIPEGFAFIMRAAGANFRGTEFQVSFAVAVGGVKAFCIVGHDKCGMSRLAGQRATFVTGLVERAGWERGTAERHFETSRPRFGIGDEIEFVRAQALYFRRQYPKLVVAPLLYCCDDGLLYVIDKSKNTIS